jgi:hypothetical protein
MPFADWLEIISLSGGNLKSSQWQYLLYFAKIFWLAKAKTKEDMPTKNQDAPIQIGK